MNIEKKLEEAEKQIHFWEEEHRKMVNFCIICQMKHDDQCTCDGCEISKIGKEGVFDES